VIKVIVVKLVIRVQQDHRDLQVEQELQAEQAPQDKLDKPVQQDLLE
jgi:hypothetical protein